MRHTPTVKQLRAFAAVYRSGKVATAAAELSLTQSAVSALIRQLEGKLGVLLFDRTTRALHRTAVADHLIATAERLLGELDGLARDVQALDSHQAGKIRVAVTPAVAQSLMPAALERFAQEQPHVRVQLEDCAPDQFLAAIVGERADFGIGVMETTHPELDARVLLFDRTTRALHRTAVADHLIGTAERLLGELDGLARDVQALDSHQAGKIRVAVTPAVAQSLMPAALERFAQEQPHVRVQLEDCAPDQFLAAIVGERADFGIGVMETTHPELDASVLLRDHLCLLCPPGHPLAASAASLRWKALLGQPLIVVRPGYGSRRAIDRAAAVAGVELQLAHEVSLLATAVAMARQGLGAAIVPATMAAQAQAERGLVARRLIAPTVPRDICLITKKGHSLGAPARRFLALLG